MNKRVIHFLLVLVTLAVSSCGRPPTLELGEFESYVRRFELRSKEFGRPTTVTDLKMQFGDLEAQNEDGVCETGAHTPLIIVSKPAWDRMDETNREILVFHELGHCVLDRHHTPVINDKGDPSSLMHPYAVESNTYNKNRTYYLSELFQGHS